MPETQKKPYVIDINGNKTFGADFIFEQMSAQGRRIDRAKSIAVWALIFAVSAYVVALVALLK